MKRFLFFFYCYAMVFITGYLVAGMLAFHYKPQPKTLPSFIKIAPTDSLEMNGLLLR